MSHKRKVRKPKMHICAFMREGCEKCPHAEAHLVVPQSGVLACGGRCEHFGIQSHCTRIRKKGKHEDLHSSGNHSKRKDNGVPEVG